MWSLAWLALVPLALIRAEVLAESDTFWETRSGLLILQQGAIPRTDPFSWTAAGEPWTLNSWGADVADGVAYSVAGLAGVAALGAIALMVLFGALLLAARRLGASPMLSAGLILLCTPLLIGWLSARPQLADYISILLVVRLLGALLEKRPAVPLLAALAGVTVVWVNLHAASLLGAAVAVTLVAVLLAARAGVRHIAQAAAGAVVCGLASAINPYGIGVLAQVGGVQASSTGLITEWQGVNPLDPSQGPLLLLALAGLMVASRRRDAVWMAAIATSTAASAVAERFLPIAVLLALPVLASTLTRPAVQRYLRSRRLLVAPGAALLVAVLGVMALGGIGRLGAPARTYPTALVQELPHHARVLNAYDFGGYVILERPDVQVFIDSRNDLYGPTRVAAAEATLAGRGDLESALRRTNAVLVGPRSGLARRLRSDAGWRVEASDDTGVLLVRTAVIE